MNSFLKIITLTAVLVYTVHIFADNMASIITPEPNATYSNGAVDSAVTKTVEIKLTNDPKLNGLSLKVSTLNGIITLTGQVKNQTQIDRAMTLAKSTAGVTKVKSKLTIAK